MSKFITPQDTEKEKFDVAIYGVWKGQNYGGIATYYALYRCITAMGLSALMIEPKMGEKKAGDAQPTHSEIFAAHHYEAITKDFSSYNLEKLNECCDTFVMGCDQIWNYEVSRAFGKSFYLDFVDDDKKKISYSSSFGHPISFTPAKNVQEVEELFHRFDFISVREEGAVSVLKNEFGVEATRVLDPVFLADPKIFDEVAQESSRREEMPYLASYILDPTPEIREALQYAAKKLNLKLVNMLDGDRSKFEANKKALNLENIPEDLQTEDWLYYLRHSQFVITDSCHGASFALVFQKPFICIGNKKRGLDRFKNLMGLFGTEDRYVLDPKKIMEDAHLLEPMDYGKIQKIMEAEKKRSGEWLRHALFAKKEREIPIGVTPQKQRKGYTLTAEKKGIALTDAIKTRIAQQWIADGGIVYLPTFADDWSVQIARVESDSELEKSAHVPSFLAEEKFDGEEIRKTLEEKKRVLFIADPYHVRALFDCLGKTYDNLSVVTILDKKNRLPGIWKTYLREVHGKREITQISFAEDLFGAERAGKDEDQNVISVTYTDGKRYEKKRKDDLFFQIFDSALAFDSCTDYKVKKEYLRSAGLILPGATLPGQNWVLADKTADWMLDVCAEIASMEETELLKLQDAVCKKMADGCKPKADCDHLANLMEKKTLKTAFHLALEGKYDVGLYGPWMSNNYGSILTYYALCRTVESMGYDVLMIERGKERYVQREDAYGTSRRFAYQNYRAISPFYDYVNQSKLNDHCDTFLLGSNQVWNYGVAKRYGFGFYFDFVREEKKKIAYAASFAHPKSHTPPSEYAHVIKLMKQFDEISVREQGSAEVLKREFNIDGPVVLDPVFLADPAIYEEQIQKVDKTCDEKFLVSYVLDPTPELRDALLEISRKTGWKIVLLSDGNNNGWKKTEEVIGGDVGTIVKDATVEEWLYYMKNCEFVVTDSCQGTNFSLLFHKPMIVIGNEKKGIVRFGQLVNLFGLEKRYVKSPGDILGNDDLLKPMEFSKIDAIMEEQRARSKEWLKTALEKKKDLPNDIRAIAKRQCCGCGACENICPVDAITMIQDKEGFYYPLIDENKCIHCGKCLKACPSAHERNVNWEKPQCYAAYTQEPVREVSSSGGIFSLVAEDVLARGGAVCGAAFDENFELAHTVVYDKEGLVKLRGSKYLQSTSKRTYREIKQILDEKKPVLFCGCPCQVAGLYGYLGRDDENLFTIDLMCHGGPSPMVFQKYLKEVHGGQKITHVGFRDKDYFGWSTEMTVKYENGKIYRKTRDKDLYYRAFLPCLSVRPHCQICKYSRLSRQGDMTLADFWGVQKYNPQYTDGKGTSILVVNNKKADTMLKKIKERLDLCEPADIGYVLTHGQPFAKPFKTYNPKRDRFMDLIEHNTMKKAVEDVAGDHYDVGICGVWTGGNYGSVMTYYTLCRTIEKMGYSVLMIEKPRISAKDKPHPLNHSRRFAYEHYQAISPMYTLAELPNLNKKCDTFVIGSDQVWNYGVNRWCKNTYYFDFAEKGKRLISYASSFGHNRSFTPVEKREEVSKLLSRFTGISVREKSAVSILKREFGIEGTQVLDPVFLPEDGLFDELIADSSHQEKEKYLLSYILDPTPQIREALQYVAEKKHLKLIHILDGMPGSFEKNKAKMNMENIVENVQVEDWLYYLKNCAFLITDSCHGASFAIRFHRPFICIYNKNRGVDRFLSLAGVFGLEKRFIPNVEKIRQDETLLEEIDYTPVEEILQRERARSLAWLEEKLAAPVKPSKEMQMKGRIRTIQDMIPVGVKRKLLPLIRDTKFYKKYIKK
ncbi:MAG: polysaccharide pyruvyl transferase family protein [Robinsoniella sp.]|nr:polysaccharide pyruvyl transferase family protein [Robinsoniella sp.]